MWRTFNFNALGQTLKAHVSCPKAIWSQAKKRPDEPPLSTLRTALGSVMKSKGGTRAENKLFILEWAKQNKHVILWTPPNRSVLNMIEYCWRNAKTYIGHYHVNFLKPKESAEYRRLHLNLGPTATQVLANLASLQMLFPAWLDKHTSRP